MSKVSLVVLVALGVVGYTKGGDVGGVSEHGSGLGVGGVVGGVGGLGGSVEESSYGSGGLGHGGIQVGGHGGGGGGHGGGGGGHGGGQDGGWGWNQDSYAHPKYSYAYGVKDTKTWDQKQASEWRDGKTVGGSYSLMEPDGSWRTVNYYDDGHGFQAQVHRTPAQHKE